MKIMDKFPKYISLFLQIFLNFALMIVSLTLVAFLIRESWLIFSQLFLKTSTLHFYSLMENILVFFLYFEFIALIVKYFESRFHFPLRYFIYIGITAIVRFIVVDHSDSLATFFQAGAILLLIIALFIANIKPIDKSK